MQAQKMTVEVSGFGVLIKKNHRSGTSERTGKPWEMFGVDFAYMGGCLALDVSEEQFNQLHENTEYELKARVIQDGYNQKVTDAVLFEVSE